MIIHLDSLSRIARRPRSGGHRPSLQSPWCDDTRGLTPKVFGVGRAGCPTSVLSCTAWGFSCLANCSASGELLPRLFTLTCALLPKNRRCLFCDTFRHRAFTNAVPASSTRHAAVWCSDFPLANLAMHQRSSAITRTYHKIRNLETSTQNPKQLNLLPAKRCALVRWAS